MHRGSDEWGDGGGIPERHWSLSVARVAALACVACAILSGAHLAVTHHRAWWAECAGKCARDREYYERQREANCLGAVAGGAGSGAARQRAVEQCSAAEAMLRERDDACTLRLWFYESHAMQRASAAWDLLLTEQTAIMATVFITACVTMSVLYCCMRVAGGAARGAAGGPYGGGVGPAYAHPHAYGALWPPPNPYAPGPPRMRLLAGDPDARSY